MLHFVCFRAYGDSLITLSQLAQCHSQEPWQVIGTGLVSRVAALLPETMQVREVLPDKPAFNTIKERGVQAAIRDFIVAYRQLRRLTSPGDTLVFEKRDIRESVLLPRGCRGIFPDASDSVYADRRELVNRALGMSVDWPEVPEPAGEIRRVTINPCARYRERWLPEALMTNVFRLCASRGWQLTIIDPCDQYGQFAAECHDYLSRPPLEAAARALRASDFYIGPDSFFIHLAYFYRMPHFGFFFPDHLLFTTPGMRQTGNWCSFEEAADYATLDARVSGYLQAA